MLAACVGLHDVDNVEAFVRGCLERFQLQAGVSLRPDEWDELVAEGIAIMCGLAERFEPHRPGYDRPGSFAGYAAAFLPKRLGDAWHRLHPDHRYVTADDGRRHWAYLQRAASFENLAGHWVGEVDQRYGSSLSLELTWRCVGDFVPVPSLATTPC